jgi:hypothetical protein
MDQLGDVRKKGCGHSGHIHRREIDGIFEALTAAGFTIIHDSENHGPTVERAAAAYEAHDKNGRDWIPGSLWDTLVREGTSRIRAMTTGGRDAD